MKTNPQTVGDVLNSDEAHPAPAVTGSRLTRIHARLTEILRPVRHFEYHPGTKNARINKHGLELICADLGLLLTYTEKPEYDGDHLTMTVHVFGSTESGDAIGSGVGMCSTKEERYAVRNAGKVCPTCNMEAIGKSKPPRGGYWCNTYRGGCGANFKDGDESIEGQITGKVPNEFIADQYHTVLAMASKRGLEDLLKKYLDIGGWVMDNAGRLGEAQQGRQERATSKPAPKAAPAADRAPSGDGASREAAPEPTGNKDAGQLMTEMMKDLIANKGDPGTLADALARWEKPVKQLSGPVAKTAESNWARYDRIRQDLESRIA